MTSFFRENWFWRGTQSAIFYYVSCAPLIDYKYKRKRRNEAARSEKQRSEIVTTQPGAIRQPGAFQTNEGWVEEILTGPGPPKGWKTDPIVQKLSSREKEEIIRRGDQLDGPLERIPTQVVDPVEETDGGYFVACPEGSLHPTTTNEMVSAERDFAQGTLSEHTSDGNTISTWSSSGPSAQPTTSRPRLSMERRLSSAVDNIRGTLRSTINLEGWNWKRYNREDEILSGFNQKMTRMWDKATNFGTTGQVEGEGKPESRGRKRAATNESDRYDYQKYARNPEINELHPPVVSRLPTTRDDAAWMLLPAPSRAVMEGKTRPQDEPALRWPLARVERNAQEWEQLKLQREQAEMRVIPEDDMSTDSTPDLSDSLSEARTSDDDLDWRPIETKRHSAPIPGWVPIKRAASDFLYVAPRREV